MDNTIIIEVFSIALIVAIATSMIFVSDIIDDIDDLFEVGDSAYIGQVHHDGEISLDDHLYSPNRSESGMMQLYV